MSTVDDIKRAIERLPKSEFRKLSEWVLRKHDDEWRRQIEEDIRTSSVATPWTISSPVMNERGKDEGNNQGTKKPSLT